MVHSSWSEFYNYTGTIEDLIDGILQIIGERGTLLMPSYPLLRKKDSIFDIDKTPTGAGLIAETFRKYPNAKRSINMHSVCAVGPLSDYLLDEHFQSITCWDQKSPYFKLGKVNGIILSLGLGKGFVGTIMHCADSILKDELPYFAQFFTTQKEVRFRVNTELISHKYWTSSDDFYYYFTNRSHRNLIRRYFDKTMYKRKKISNLTVNVYDAEYFIQRSIEIGRKGITVYLKPNPKDFF